MRWIGGGSGAGKSAVAHRLAVTHGLTEYSTDEAIHHHAVRLNSTRAPLLSTFLAMDMNERWVVRSPKVMFETFPWFHGERFDLIVEDIAALADAGPILAEGFRLLPRLVAPLLDNPNEAVWLIPTTDFRRRVFGARGSRWFPYETSNSRRAIENLLARDAMFSEQLLQDTASLGLPVIMVDGTITLDELTRRVGASLGLPAD